MSALEAIEQAKQDTDDFFTGLAHANRHQVVVLDISDSMREAFHGGGSDSRLDVAKRMLQAEIAERAQRCEEHFALATFNYHLNLLVEEGAGAVELSETIARIRCTGGTKLDNGLNEGVGYFEEREFPVPLNHLLIVTDLEGHYSKMDAQQTIARAKAASVSVDVIWIKPAANSMFTSVDLDGVQALTDATGGRFITVSTGDEMETVFRQLAQRTVLLIGAGQ